MKIRYVVLGYTLFIMCAMTIFYGICTREEHISRDMVYYNEQLISINNYLQQDIDRNKIEDDHECKIILMKDEDYGIQLNKVIQRGDVLMDLYQQNEIIGKIAWKPQWDVYHNLKKQILYKVVLMCIFVLFLGYAVLGIIYFYFLKPFNKLKKFSLEIAKGNLDFPLSMDRHNLFGAFTESFDIMREELKRARECEYKANRSKKELVAGLSHDIKTPLSTIKATCEVMLLKEKEAETLEKVGVVAAKADMIDHLVDNMFHATMEELETLKVEITEESSLLIEQIIRELKYYGEIVFQNHMPPCLVYIDKLRIQQVIDNIVNNSYKYAGTEIYVSFAEEDHGIQIKLHDRGKGIDQEEIMMITEKFYRGSNAKGKSGAGLGLYLSKMFMNGMKGHMECYNEDGFTVILYIRKV